ncbi:uncharacterized protein IL334_006856 [Kwoniella shivajii]|uniref:CRAL-TRIO domain-containing protein n=1 Tax=Kwoniella shivajii TaxID=564305 RepID=A0ABZ1D738_9TREE|nr:hypothetical protein IL334_006856 [Kwoniella shivajii]
MSSFFSRSNKSASSSSSSLNKDGQELKSTSEIFTTPSQESSVKKKWDYNEEQLKQIEELKAFSHKLLLPESDVYHPWELRFLNDPGTHPRYMRAAKWKMDDAKKRIQGTIEWRREYKPELIQPDDVGIEAETGKIVLSGFDFDSRPILYMRPGRENTERSPRQIRHLIYHLERALDLMPPGQEQVAIIVDYKSATSQSNPSIAVARQVLNILQNHYVERLGRGLVVNMPWWINAFFTGITPFLDPITRDKIRFNPKLTELVPAAQLDSEFGGNYRFDFDHKVYWPTLTEFCHIAPDGTRINDQGEKIYPPSGNGIKAALEGLHPVKGAIASGQVEKVDPSKNASVTPTSGTDQSTRSQTGNETEKLSNVSEPQSTNTAVTADMTTTATTNVNSDSNTEGLEEGVKRLSLNRALTTVPGPPEGDAVFDHPPSEGEIAQARQSIEGSR